MAGSGPFAIECLAGNPQVKHEVTVLGVDTQPV